MNSLKMLIYLCKTTEKLMTHTLINDFKTIRIRKLMHQCGAQSSLRKSIDMGKGCI